MAVSLTAWRFRCPLPVLFWSLTPQQGAFMPLHMGFAEADVTLRSPFSWLVMLRAGNPAREGYPADGAGHGISEWHQDICDGLLDNCEVSRAFMRPVLKGIHERLGLETGSVMVVSSHTHSGPILADTLDVMAIMPEKDQEWSRHTAWSCNPNSSK